MDVVLPAPDQLKVVSRRQYDPKESIAPTSVAPNPFEQFRTWLTEVRAAVLEPEAMALSTASAAGVPSTRFVLFKQLDRRGFVFYTNYASRKSAELAANPHAALAFYWKEVSRQVRVVGRVERLTRAESEEYYRSRPLGSRLGAWASPQSEVVAEDELAKRLDEVKTKFGVDESTKEADVPLPEFWGGWRVIPDEIEFWMGKPSRLHDRVRYLRVEGSSDDDPQWKIERLAP
ncbi:pyridoxamine 5'-phosphate oxidase [Phanerochaete sordida]|uniref:pyridoxal 5'-phosphate synthase n=1 Tax=Phanerochaete sordida TaxID=48140 RepID=A0A9P3LK96_9APHY|nr:pyridoxamine 5'-phosphate oxidase [Phanerochaete sordida]